MSSIYDTVSQSMGLSSSVTTTQSQNGTAIRVLQSATTVEITQKVRECVENKMSEDDLRVLINSTNAHQYLAAAKLLDLESQSSLTFLVRKTCVLCSNINLINAFTNPPLNKENLTVLLANELDNSHPEVIKVKDDREKSDLLLKSIYNYAQQEAQLTPEMKAIVEEIIAQRFRMIREVASKQPENTIIMFKGNSGTGKTYAIKQLLGSEDVVQSTDGIKNDLIAKTGGIYNNSKVHLLGMSIFKNLERLLKEHFSNLSLIQEQKLNSKTAIIDFFKSLSTQRLMMHDLEADFETQCMRILARMADPTCPTPPLDVIQRGYTTTRESRALLLSSLRECDTYQFTFAKNNGEIVQFPEGEESKRAAAALQYNKEQGESEMSAVLQMPITSEHVRIFGSYLAPFVGKTVLETFGSVKRT